MNKESDSPICRLLAACDRGDFETVRSLVELGIDVNVRDEDGSALYRAAKKGHVQVLKVLLQHGANVNTTNGRRKWSALMVACQTECLSVVQLLLEHGANVNIRGKLGVSALFIASKCGSTEVVDTLLIHGADVNVQDRRGRSVLMVASENNNVDIVKILLDQRAKVNMEDVDGWSAVIIASQCGCTGSVSLLLRYGACAMNNDIDGFLALMIATQNGHIKTVQELLKYGVNVNKQVDGWTALMIACQYGHNELTSLLLEQNADVNKQYKNGMTALMLASLLGNTAIVAQLLKYRANMNMQEVNNLSALIIASQNGHAKTAELLLKHGAYADMKDKGGRTALISASKMGYSETAEVLLTYYANVNIQDINGKSALIYASYNGYTTIVKLLLNHQVDMDILDSDGLTALFYAYQNVHNDVVTLLIKYGANLDCQRKSNGQTILMLAIQKQDTETVQQLLEFGANVDIQDDNGYTALIIASEIGHAKTVDVLLKFGANVNIQDESGQTALIAATKENNSETVKLLIRSGANIINTQDKFGCTALMMACEKGYSDIVSLLLKHTEMVDVNIQDINGWTALFYAYWNRHDDAAILLIIKHTANLDCQHNTSGQTILMIAIRRRDVKFVKQLLELGTNVNIQNKSGQTALIIAAENRNTEAVKLLIKSGANSNTQNRRGCTALMIACEKGYFDIVTLLIEPASILFANNNRHTEGASVLLNHQTDMNIQDLRGWTALFYAYWNRHEAVVALLIKYGANLDCQCKSNGQTILMIAIQRRDTKTAKQLLELGANVDIQDKRGQTALIIATKKGDTETVKLLLKHGAKVNIQDKGEQTALTAAIEDKNIETVKLLIKSGVNTNIQNRYGCTALMMACERGYFDIVSLLIEPASESILANDNTEKKTNLQLNHQADVNIQDVDGWTALFYAYWNGHKDVVTLLINYGANLNCQIKPNGQTILMIAIKKRDTEIVKLLIKSGANMNIQNIIGHTALTITCENGYSDIVTLLIEPASIFANNNENTEAANLQLNHEIDVNIPDFDGLTAIFYAYQNGHDEIATMLIKYRANLDCQSITDGQTILMIAIQKRDTETVKLLLEFGANTDIQNYNGYTALHIASKIGDAKSVEALLKFGANVNIQDNSIQTALIVATENRNVTIIALLIECGANLNTQNGQGCTALMIACEKGYTALVILLLVHKSDVNIQNQDGWTALMFACQYGNAEIANYLIDYGADVNLMKKDGWTALTLANMNHHIDTVKLLTKYGAKDAVPKKKQVYDIYTTTYTATGTEDSGYGPSAEQGILSHEKGNLRNSRVHSTVISMTSSEQYFNWEGYGMHLYIPEDALPPEIEVCMISIEASTEVNYAFPENLHPVSAIFWFHCDPKCKFLRPITLEIQHCAKQQSLSFVKARSADCQSGIQFNRAHGSCGTDHGVFPSYSSYGFIQLDGFCGYGVVQEGSEDRQYRANLYYLPQSVSQCQIHFTVLWNTDAHHSVIKSHYLQQNAEIGPDKPIEFNSESIRLDIPKKGIATEDDMWKIFPLVFPPQVTKKEVDSFDVGKRIPACQLQACAQNSQQHHDITDLIHPLKLLGTRTLHDYITLFRSPASTVTPVGAHESIATPNEDLVSVQPPSVPPRTYKDNRKSKQVSLSQTTSHTGTLEQHQFLPSYPLQECTFQNSALLATEANTETSLSHKGDLATNEVLISFQRSQSAALLPSAIGHSETPQSHEKSITATFQHSLTTLVPQPPVYAEPPRFATLLYELTTRVAAKWEEIGTSLQLESGLLEIIKKDNPNDCRACLREMLKEWMKQVDPPPSWSVIIKAIKDCGYRPLARTLREKYLSNSNNATLS